MASLRLDDALGNSIPNDQDLHGDLQTASQSLELLRRRWEGADCKMRRPVIYRYNCHGLTFASRRTWIDDLSFISKIIANDGYQQIDIRIVGPGDIIAYIDNRGRIDHSGIVISEPELQTPWVLSKWAWAGEFVHRANICPYAENHKILYYRLMNQTVKKDENRPSIIVP